MILGHAWEPVVAAIREYAAYSTSYGAPTELEVEMAELIRSMAPNVDLVRMVSSGTEACMSAIRLARAFTGRNKIIKFEGHYHGHADPFLVKAGSGVATFNIQTVPGVTPGVVQDTVTAAYNDLGRGSAAGSGACRGDCGDHCGTGGGEHGLYPAGAGFFGRVAGAL